MKIYKIDKRNLGNINNNPEKILGCENTREASREVCGRHRVSIWEVSGNFQVQEAPEGQDNICIKIMLLHCFLRVTVTNYLE